MKEDSFIEQELRAEGRSLGDPPTNFDQQPQPQTFNVNGYMYSGKRQTTNDAALVFKIVGGIFVGIGVLILVIGVIVTHFMQQSYDACSETTTAVVIDNIRHDDTYAPVFAYTVDGKDYEEKSSYSTYPAKYDIGDKVELHYEPSKPSNFYVDKSINLVRGILFGLGGFFVVFGTVFVIIGIKAKVTNQRL